MWAVSYFARHAKNPSEFLKLREKMLFLTCTGTRLPDVGKYVYGRHSGIVYDEGTPEMVWDNREIFQGLAEVSTIADTHTHRSAQQVCLNGCRQVITCNDWNERLKLLPDVQRQWLESFAIVAEVDYELYTATPFVSSSVGPGSLASFLLELGRRGLSSTKWPGGNRCEAYIGGAPPPSIS